MSQTKGLRRPSSPSQCQPVRTPMSCSNLLQNGRNFGDWNCCLFYVDKASALFASSFDEQTRQMDSYCHIQLLLYCRRFPRSMHGADCAIVCPLNASIISRGRIIIVTTQCATPPTPVTPGGGTPNPVPPSRPLARSCS